VGEVDGRRQRRAGNRDAVLHALVELFGEGRYQPSTVEIAERAGISPRSLFRYFDDQDDLVRAAVDQSLAEARPLFDVDIDPGAPTDEKVDAIVASRLRLFEAIAPAARAARISAHRHEVLASQVRDSRAHLRAQLRRTFKPELSNGGAERFPALDALCSFETYELLRIDQRMSARRTADALATAISALLGTP
jgi:AcrR family transcriptional regulator